MFTTAHGDSVAWNPLFSCSPKDMRGAFGYPGLLGERDGEDSVLQLLQPPSIAENSFDPVPMDTEPSWNYEEDCTAIELPFVDHDSASPRIHVDNRALVNQDCKGHEGVYSSSILAGQFSAYQTHCQTDAPRVQHTAPPDLQRWTPNSLPVSELMTPPHGNQLQRLSTAAAIQRFMGGTAESDDVLLKQKFVEQLWRSGIFPDSFIRDDEDTTASFCNVIPRYNPHRLSSAHDAELDDGRRRLDPGYYVQQTVTPGPELSGPLRCEASDACELTALVLGKHTCNDPRKMPTSSTPTCRVEPLADIYHQPANRCSVFSAADWSCVSGQPGSHHNSEAQFSHVSLEVSAAIKELGEDVGGPGGCALIHDESASNGGSYAYEEVTTPYACHVHPTSAGLLYDAADSVCDPRPHVPLLPGLDAGTHVPENRKVSGEEIRRVDVQLQQVERATVAAAPGDRDLYAYDTFLSTQAWSQISMVQSPSATYSGLTDHENVRSSSQPLRGLSGGSHQQQADQPQAEAASLSMEGLIASVPALIKLPLTSNWQFPQVLAADVTSPAVYSTRVSSELERASEERSSLSVVNETTQSTASSFRLKRKLDHSSGLCATGPQQNAWAGLVHQELSPGIARLQRYCHSGLVDLPKSSRVLVNSSSSEHHATFNKVSVLHQASSPQYCHSGLADLLKSSRVLVNSSSSEHHATFNKVSVRHQASPPSSASLFTTAHDQNFQPSIPDSEDKMLEEAASSLLELCGSREIVQPLPLAVRPPPKLSEVDMARLLQAYRHLDVLQVKEHFPFVKEADVYALHPSDLIAGAGPGGGQYFFSETKYGSIKKPTRLRITKNGYRWKQQGRTFAIQDGGRTVAFKTYLSYVPLKNTSKLQLQGQNSLICGAPLNRQRCFMGCNGNPHGDSKSASSTLTSTSTGSDRISQPIARSELTSGYCKASSGSHRKWALWTMEEIALAEDVDIERKIFKRGGVPKSFPVLCKIGCRAPMEENGDLSRSVVPFAVPISHPRPGLSSRNLDRRSRRFSTRLRHQFKKVMKHTYGGILLTGKSGADGQSLSATFGTCHLPPSNPNPSPRLLLTC